MTAAALRTPVRDRDPNFIPNPGGMSDTPLTATLLPSAQPGVASTVASLPSGYAIQGVANGQDGYRQ